MKFKKGDHIITTVTSLIDADCQYGLIIQADPDVGYDIEFDGDVVSYPESITFIDPVYELNKKKMRSKTIKDILQ